MAIEVAAAVVQRADGSFLLACRPAGKVYAGYWEFPGGKVEPGEELADALARELHEELGIEVTESYPWLTRTFTYPHGTVRLHFRRVTAWGGTPRPRERQEIAWQQLGAPLVQPMLPANAPVLAALALPVEYAVTDAARLGVPEMLRRLERRLAGGLRLVQVREPELPAHDRDAFTARALELASAYGARVMTKAPYAGAHGTHYTARELMALDERPASTGLVAASCHTREELERAMALGLDFAVVGPVLETPSHPQATGLGWAKLKELVRASSIPVYAIGGLEPGHLVSAWTAGAHGIAMKSAAWRA